LIHDVMRLLLPARGDRASKTLDYLAVAVFMTAAATAAGCGRHETAQAKGNGADPRSVQTESVRLDTVRRALDATGMLVAGDEAIVSSQADGLVTRILADLGDAVAAGQPLVELDTEKLRYTVEQQRAALRRSLTKYGAADAAALPAVDDTPDVRRAEAELAQAKRVASRSSRLMDRGLVSGEAFDDAQAALQTRQASYDAAVQTARNLAADIEVEEAALRLAERQLRDAVIRAPISGYIQKRLVAVGELVRSQAPVMSVVRVDSLKVRAEIPERMAPWVRVGQSVALKVDSHPTQGFHATVTRISPVVEAATRTVALEATTTNDGAVLKPGAFVRIHLETALEEPVLTIPYTAMQYRYGVNRAFVVNGGKLAARELSLGDRLGDRIEIAAGVKAEEVIATTDIDVLVDGEKVTRRQDAAAR
jgi:multidrug resistance efflux pump